MKLVEIGDQFYPVYVPWWERVAQGIRRVRRKVMNRRMR